MIAFAFIGVPLALLGLWISWASVHPSGEFAGLVGGPPRVHPLGPVLMSVGVVLVAIGLGSG